MVNLPRFPEADAPDMRITSPCCWAAPVPLQPLRLAQAMGTALGWRSFIIIPGRRHPSGAAFLRLRNTILRTGLLLTPSTPVSSLRLG